MNSIIENYINNPDEQQSLDKIKELLKESTLKQNKRGLTQEQMKQLPQIFDRYTVLQKMLNTIKEARRLTSASVDLIGAVRSDLLAPLDVLRQMTLFVKECILLGRTT